MSGEFHARVAELNWVSVPGASYYRVRVYAGDFIGPIAVTCACGYKAWTPNYNVAYRSLSGHARTAGIRLYLVAYDRSNHAIGYSNARVRAHYQGRPSKPQTQAQAKNKIKSCLQNGEVAAGGVVVGAGVINAVADWFPGVNVVSVSGTAISALTAGAYSSIVCLVK